MIALQGFFFLCLFIVFYTYVGYGIVLFCLIQLKRLFKDGVQNGEDGLLSKDFMVKLHTLFYKHKRFGSEMIQNANFHERIVYL